MAQQIKQLSEYVANQIAAGEVVRNGASVVKELMENAIDAGCSWIIVRIRGGGIEYLQVADDGCGMSHDDALKAFSRHATSKISEANDIFSIETFGFRGEALPSIASVAEVELKSRQEEDELGVLVEMNGSELVQHTACATAKGTQIVVKNLFYNIPARRKHLKTPQRESRYIIDEFMKIALCYPQVALFFYNDDICMCNFRASNLRQRVVSVMSSSLTKVSEKESFASTARMRNIATKCNGSLIEMFAETSIVKVCGYIGKPETAKKSAEQYLFVNGRYFRSPALRKAIQNAYDKLLSDNTVLPPYFIYLTVDPSKIDVNIHPAKTEVKFEEENEIWQILHAAIRESLGKHGIVPMIDFEAGAEIDIPIFRSTDTIKPPELDINHEFNPFDESFSFTNAVKGLDETFRNNITQEMYASTQESVQTQPYIKEFSDKNWEEAFYDETSVSKTDGNELSTIESYSDFIISSSMQEDEAFIEIDSQEGLSDLIEIESSANTPSLVFDSRQLHIGSFFLYTDRWAVVLINNSLYVVDLVYAMDRIAYERMEQQINQQSAFASQKLLFPVDFSLSIQDACVVRDSLDEFRFMGFEITLSDEDLIEITGVPAQWNTSNTEALFEEVLSALKMDELYSFKQSKKEKMIRGLAGIYARSNNLRTNEQIESCIRELFECVNFTYSPSGHKIFVRFEESEIKKRLH